MKISLKTLCRTEKINKNGKAPIYICVTQNRKRRYITLGIAVEPHFWDFTAQMLTPDCPERREYQQKIDTKIEALNKQIRRLEALDMEVTFDALTGARTKQINPTIEECFQHQIERLKEAGKVSTSSKYAFTLSSLQKFNSTAKMSDINLSFLQDFELFMRKAGNTDNSIATKMSVLKALYNKSLHSLPMIQRENPFIHYKIGSLWTQTRKRAVSKETIQKLAQLDFSSSNSPYRGFARDIFLFSYYTAGMNFKDIALLRYADVQDGRVSYHRRKTKKAINCVLINPGREVMERYWHAEHAQDDYIFPILHKETHKTEQQMHDRIHKVLSKINRNLREISTVLGLKTPITTYSARHTYATVLKRSGVNIALISESLGHSDISTTQIYLDSFDDSQLEMALQNLL